MSGRRRGWCPTLFDPMPSGDGLLARVKPPLGRISAAAARALAAAARRWGAGQLDLTNRGALQARGFSEPSMPAFREAVVEAGLASADPAVERRRNVILSPFAAAAAAALAAELERWIAEDEALAALPAKFGYAVAGETDPHPLPGDIRLMPLGVTGRKGDVAPWRICLADGLGRETGAPLATAQHVTHQFLRLAADLDPPPRRMADLVRHCGPEAVWADADSESSPAGGGAPFRSDPPLRSGGGGLARSAKTEGAFLVAGPIGDGFALGLPFGAMTAEQFNVAADLADHFADGVLRLSPWRALVLAGVPEAATTEFATAARAAGFVVDPADPRLSVVACAGAPACASAHAATRVDAGRVAARSPEGLIHLSGCAKGCAHPAAAPFAIVAAPDGYGVVRNGRASDAPERRGLTLEAALDLLAAEPSEIP